MRTMQENQLSSTFSVAALDNSEAESINGGGFAYDAGFFLRECWVYLKAGPGPGGIIDVAVDLSLNYRPVN